MANSNTKFVTLLNLLTLVTCIATATDVHRGASVVFELGIATDSWFSRFVQLQNIGFLYRQSLESFEGSPGKCQNRNSLLYDISGGNCKKTDIRFATIEHSLGQRAGSEHASVKELRMILTVRADPDDSNCADGSTLQYAQMDSDSDNWTSMITGSIGSAAVQDKVSVKMHYPALYVPQKYENEIRQLLSSAIAEGRSSAPLSLTIGNSDSTVTVLFDLMALKATNNLRLDKGEIWAFGFSVLKKYYTVWDSEKYRIGLCTGKSSSTDSAPVVSEYPRVVQFTLPGYYPTIQMRFLYDADLEILADTGASGTSVNKNAFISRRGHQVLHKSNQVTSLLSPYFCGHSIDNSPHYLRGTFGPLQEGADMHLMPIKIGEPKCWRCPQKPLLGMGPWTAFMEDELLNWWTKGLPKVFTFLAKNEGSGELTVGQEADPTKCREGNNIEYINVDPISETWTIQIEKIEIYNSNGGKNLLEKVELPVIDAVVDTGANAALVLPEAMVESIKAQILPLGLYSTVTVKVTLRSALDSQSFILQQNFKTMDMRLWLGTAHGPVLIGYPLMMGSYMVFNSDEKTIGACPSRHQVSLDFIRDVGHWSRLGRYLTQKWKRVKKAIGW